MIINSWNNYCISQFHHTLFLLAEMPRNLPSRYVCCLHLCTLPNFPLGFLTTENSLSEGVCDNVFPQTRITLFLKQVNIKMLPEVAEYFQILSKHKRFGSWLHNCWDAKFSTKRHPKLLLSWTVQKSQNKKKTNPVLYPLDFLSSLSIYIHKNTLNYQLKKKYASVISSSTKGLFQLS